MITPNFGRLLGARFLRRLAVNIPLPSGRVGGLFSNTSHTIAQWFQRWDYLASIAWIVAERPWLCAAAGG